MYDIIYYNKMVFFFEIFNVTRFKFNGFQLWFVKGLKVSQNINL